MTVSSEDFRISHNGNGTTGPFSFNFLAYEIEHLEVVRLDLDGVETTLEPTTDFTAVGLGNEEGGTIDLTDALEVGEKITITVNPPPVQELDLNDDDDFPADAIELQLDLMVMMIRRDRTVTERALILRTSDVDGEGAFNARENRITNLGTPVDESDAVTLGFIDDQLAEMEALLEDAAEEADASAASAVSAASQVTLAAAQVTLATAQKTLAQGYASDADDAAELAQLWASEAENVVVADGKYSAYHYMLQAAAIADVEALGIPISAIDGMVADNVQAALEEIDDALDIVIGDIDTVAQDLADALVAIDGDFDAVDTALSGKANASHTHLMADITDLVIESELPKNYLSGFTLSNNAVDTTNDIDIAAGICRDSTDTVNIVLSAAITKRLDATFVAGTGNGMRHTTAIANTTYHLYVICDANGGNVDVFASTNASDPSSDGDYPAGYKFRRIGSIVRASAAIRRFTQTGDLFLWASAIRDFNVTSVGTAAITRTLSLPTGVKFEAYVHMHIYGASDPHYGLASSLDEQDVAPTLNAHNFAYYTATAQYGEIPMFIRTNTSAQIRVRLSSGGASDGNQIWTLGWRDLRGKEG